MSLAKVKAITNLAENLIERFFQLDRLDELARGSSFIRIAHAELICLANYVILAQEEILLEELEIAGWTITGHRYPPTLEGKTNAMSKVFGHVASKLDMALNTTNFARVLAELDFIGDIAKAAIPQTRYRYYAKIPSPK